MIPFIVTAAILFALSFILTVDNADGLLSGYNTLSDERKAKYDIHKIVPFTNNLLRISAGFILLGGALANFFDSGIIGIISIIYLPVLILIGGGIYSRFQHTTDPIRLYEKILYTAIIALMIYLTVTIQWSEVTLESLTTAN
ncbi:DUF3784 domain-containing protein [Myroides phaeus]|uniref:UbiA prenyltransferase family protein n=1 Tax=Myroides phaeus TaxID=702745 RepID=A0A1G8F342_9FLAO|nr:DUF3784 domain-containing protein [Myroides phaeus]SDH76565.1 protein of unknown function [Myroides phaeus]